MQRSTLWFWLILVTAVLLAVASIGLVLKIAQILIWLLFIAILTPIFYLILRLILPKSFTGKPNKLKRRD